MADSLIPDPNDPLALLGQQGRSAVPEQAAPAPAPATQPTVPLQMAQELLAQPLAQPADPATYLQQQEQQATSNQLPKFFEDVQASLQKYADVRQQQEAAFAQQQAAAQAQANADATADTGPGPSAQDAAAQAQAVMAGAPGAPVAPAGEGQVAGTAASPIQVSPEAMQAAAERAGLVPHAGGIGPIGSLLNRVGELPGVKQAVEGVTGGVNRAYDALPDPAKYFIETTAQGYQGLIETSPILPVLKMVNTMALGATQHTLDPIVNATLPKTLSQPLTDVIDTAGTMAPWIALEAVTGGAATPAVGATFGALAGNDAMTYWKAYKQGDLTNGQFIAGMGMAALNVYAMTRVHGGAPLTPEQVAGTKLALAENLGHINEEAARFTASQHDANRVSVVDSQTGNVLHFERAGADAPWRPVGGVDAQTGKAFTIDEQGRRTDTEEPTATPAEEPATASSANTEGTPAPAEAVPAERAPVPSGGVAEAAAAPAPEAGPVAPVAPEPFPESPMSRQAPTAPAATEQARVAEARANPEPLPSSAEMEASSTHVFQRNSAPTTGSWYWRPDEEKPFIGTEAQLGHADIESLAGQTGSRSLLDRGWVRMNVNQGGGRYSLEGALPSDIQKAARDLIDRGVDPTTDSAFDVRTKDAATRTSGDVPLEDLANGRAFGQVTEAAPAGTAASASPATPAGQVTYNGSRYTVDGTSPDGKTVVLRAQNGNRIRVPSTAIEGAEAASTSPVGTSPMSKAIVKGEGGETRAVAGFDKSLIPKLGEKLYEGDLGAVATKELLQNAIDSVRGRTDGQINLDINTRERTISISDNGHGMLPDVVTKEFVDIGGSVKQTEDASGGFGLAKVAILANADNINVRTVAQDANGKYIRTTLSGSGQDWATERGLKVEHAEVLPGKFAGAEAPRTGTTVQVKLGTGPGVRFNQYEVQGFAKNFVNNTDIPGVKIDAVIDGQPVEPPRRYVPGEDGAPGRMVQGTSDYTPLTTLHIPGADIEIRGSPIVTEQFGVQARVLNNGMYQFGQQFNLPRPLKVPAELIINVKAHAGPDAPNYPFTTSRERMSAIATETVQNWIHDNLATAAASEERALLVRVFKSAPEIPDPYNTGIKLRVFDTTGEFDKHVTGGEHGLPSREGLANRPYVYELSERLYDVFDTLHNIAYKRGIISAVPGTTEFKGMGLDPSYLGVSIRMDGLFPKEEAPAPTTEDQGGPDLSDLGQNVIRALQEREGRVPGSPAQEGELPPDIHTTGHTVMSNPWRTWKEIEVARRSGDMVEEDTIREFAGQLVATMAHELVHSDRSGHYEDFAGTLTRLTGIPAVMRAMLSAQDSIEAYLRDLEAQQPFRWQEFIDDATALNQYWDDTSLKNVVSRSSDSALAGEPAAGRGAGLPEATGVGGTPVANAVRQGGAGAGSDVSALPGGPAAERSVAGVGSDSGLAGRGTGAEPGITAEPERVPVRAEPFVPVPDNERVGASGLTPDDLRVMSNRELSTLARQHSETITSPHQNSRERAMDVAVVNEVTGELQDRAANGDEEAARLLTTLNGTPIENLHEEGQLTTASLLQKFDTAYGNEHTDQAERLAQEIQRRAQAGDDVARAHLQDVLDDLHVDRGEEPSYQPITSLRTMRTKPETDAEYIHRVMPELTDAQIRDLIEQKNYSGRLTKKEIDTMMKELHIGPPVPLTVAGILRTPSIPDTGAAAALTDSFRGMVQAASADALDKLDRSGALSKREQDIVTEEKLRRLTRAEAARRAVDVPVQQAFHQNIAATRARRSLARADSVGKLNGWMRARGVDPARFTGKDSPYWIEAGGKRTLDLSAVREALDRETTPPLASPYDRPYGESVGLDDGPPLGGCARI